ncbi:BCDIN3D family protein [Megaselia abdita]
MSRELDFYSNDPGAVQHGNFINYYSFNKVEERLEILPKGIWKKKALDDTKSFLILDVGCNSGDLTQNLKTFFEGETGQNVEVLGIDIDSALIDRANKANKDSNITFHTVNIMEDSNCVKEFLISKNRTTFDVVCCFSITMWIHLNNKDEGLRVFLEKCSKIAETLVVEPQPWKCYQTAVRRMKRAKEEGFFPHFKALEWRTDVEDQIERFLEEDLRRKKVCETEKTKWKRKICVFE